MKFLVTLFTLAFFASTAFAQPHLDSTANIFLRHPTVPPFKLVNVVDSSQFTKDDLVKKKATIIMMFSPDCEHCQEMTKKISANIRRFKKAQIIMASPLDLSYLRKFYNDYGLAAHSHTITMGRDVPYFLGTFYKVRSFPSFFVYSKKGKLVNWFKGEEDIEAIIKSIQ